MAIFGFIVVVLIALWLTFATLFCLFCGGLDMGPAKLPVWLVSLPLLLLGWWQVAELAPFSIVVGG